MDPISIILAALATAGAQVGGEAVSDAYAGLKGLILRRFGGGHARLEQDIEDYVADQDTYEKPAREALETSGAAEDEEVLALATELLRKAEAASPGITGGLVGQINAENVAVAHTINDGVHFGKT
jgi:hypothetical protein